MLQEFEKDGCKYQIDSHGLNIDGVYGHWCSRYEWDRDKKAFILSAKTFIPSLCFPKTRQRIVDCFTYGTGFVYLRERQARRERWLNSPQYQEWLETRKILIREA